MMNYLSQPKHTRQSLIVSETDYYRLCSVINHEKRLGNISRKRLNRIRKLLRDVCFYPILLFPADIVTMNSVVELIVPNGPVWIVRLVYPHETKKDHRRISVFSSLGMNLLGRQTGQPIRLGRMRIGSILYQPETFNHFHL